MQTSTTVSLSDEDFAALLDRALGGEGEALNELVAAMTPVVHVRVARALRRRRDEARGRPIRQDCEDLVQDVFTSLFDRGAKALRAWDPARGLGFLSFVGFLAEREVAMRLRSAKRNPWTEEPMEDEKLSFASGGQRFDGYIESRDLLHRLLDELRTWLTPEGRQYFQLLFIEQKPVAQVAEEANTTAEALYAWRSRLTKKMRKLRAELATEESGRA